MTFALILFAALTVVACHNPGARRDASEGPPEIVEPPLRVAVLGTSLAAGYGLVRPAQEAYPALLQAACDQRGWRVTIVNHGVSGSTSAAGLARLDAVLKDSLDVLVVELGGNDALRGLSPTALRRNLIEIVRRTQARYPDTRVVLAGLTLPSLSGSIPYASVYQRAIDRYRLAFEVAAAETGATLVPSLLEGVAGVLRLNQSDLIHPTAEGQHRLFSNLWPVMEAVLEEVREDAQRRASRASGLTRAGARNGP